MFFDQVVFCDSPTTMSLSDHCVSLKNKFDINISKQGLDQRFNPSAVEFIKCILKDHLKDMIFTKMNRVDLHQFSSVLIKDSTRFQVDKNLHKYFPGSTGAASGAAIHIQFEYDLLSGRLNDLTLSDGLRQDSTDAQQSMQKVEAGSLQIRDLGYSDLKVFKQIDSQEAFFLSRLSPSTSIYQYVNEQYQQITVDDLYGRLKREKKKRLELDVFIGSKVKLPVRMVFEKMPEKEFSEKLKKITKQRQKKQKKVSPFYRKWIGLQILITNIPSTRCAAGHLWRLYKLRWQIELVFKTWKSVCQIDQTGRVNPNRLLCYLYATLLYIMINWEAFYQIQIRGINKGKPMISIQKFYKTVQLWKFELRSIYLGQIELLGKYLQKLLECCNKLLYLESKKNREGFQEILTRKMK